MEHTSSTDRIVFGCAHGKTEAFLPDNRGGEGVLLAVRGVMTAHAAHCACQPEVLVTEWPSLAEALSIFEADAVAELAASRPHGEAVNTVHGLALDTMREYACPSCDPRFTQISRRGVLENHVVHQDGCPNGSRHRRREQVLDMGGPAIGGVA